jgi:hypothetical protein
MAAFATSYIKTEGATVTRAADAASMTGTNFSSWFNNAEGSLYVDASVFSVFQAGEFVRIEDASGNNRWDIMAHGSSASELSTSRNRIVINSSITDGSGPALTRNQFYKISANLLSGTKSASWDGASVVTNTQTLVPQNLIEMEIMRSISGRIKKLAYYPEAVTDAQLQALTA